VSDVQPGVERRMVETGDALLALRNDKDFHDGALSVLTYPTAPPVGYIGYEEFKSMTGKLVLPGPGVYVDKGPAGDFEVGKVAV
jgi:hypothetical protein